MNPMNFQLGAEQSARLLAQALRAGVTIIVEPRTRDDAGAVETALVGQREDVIDVRLEDRDALPSLPLQGACCDCRLLLGQAQYVFETYVVDCRTADAGAILSLARPKALAVLERRQYPRARLADSCDVHLRWGPPPEVHTVAGKLLNLSAQGMACQVDQATAADMLIGNSVEAALPLGKDGELIELPAIVRNKTPGGSPGTCLLGLQFTRTGISAPAIDRLGRHLATCQPSTATTE